MTLDALEFTKTADNKKTLDNETNSNDSEFQYARIQMIFDVKSDGTRKTRLVIGDYTTNPRAEIDCYSLIMQ